LDGAVFSGGTFLGHDVDAYISDVSFLGPFIPKPDVRKALGVERVQFEVLADQPLEAVAKVAFVNGRFAEFFENVMDRFFHVSGASFVNASACGR
jgi:hypothetical protein